MVKADCRKKCGCHAPREGLKMHHRHHVRSCGRRSGNSRLHSRLRGSLGGVALCAALASGLAFAQDTSPSGAGGDIGAMFPGLAQYKMLALDGGGGTSDFGQSKPYFWGMRAIEPDDDFTGALKYWKATDPKIKRVSLVYIDQGPANEIVIGNFNKALADTGLQLASSEVTTIGATDYSATIARLKSANHEPAFLFNIGVDPGYFMKQFVNAGLTMPVIGAEYISDAAKVAGPAYDNYMFATDWFNAAKPTNPWSKLFLDSYVKEFSLEPEINAANYYEDTFAMWDIIRRVLAKGGNVKSGEELQNALIANPKFQSVYGGNSSEVGTIELNTTTHSVTKRPLGISMSNGCKPNQLASFGL